MGVYEKTVLFEKTTELLDGHFLDTELLVDEGRVASMIGGVIHKAEMTQPSSYFFAARTHETPATYLYGFVAPTTGFLGYVSIVDAPVRQDAATAGSDNSFEFFRWHIATAEYRSDISRRIASAINLQPPKELLPSPFYVDPMIIRKEFFDEWVSPPSDLYSKLNCLHQFRKLADGSE